MAGLKEIRRRIGSVKNTRQITRAMKLVSAAKLRRAQEAALSGRHFAERLEAAIATVLSDLPESFSHPFLQRGSSDLPRRVVVIAGERGLCGAYNTNLIKAAQQGDLTSPAEVVSVGRRAVSSAKRFGWSATGSFEGFAEDVSKWPIEEIVEAAVKDFDKVQEVVVYYTKFISALSQKVSREVLIPLDRKELCERVEARGGKTRESSYSQDPVEIIQALVPLYVRAKIREAALESKASEHAARMTAMDSATNNASDLIDKLRLYYNRARQGAITKELLDIIGGAEAIE